MNEVTLKELVHYVASNISKEMSFNSLKKILGMGSSTTIKEYFDYLQNSYLIFLVTKFSTSLKKQIYANKKMYMIDTGLAINTGFRITSDKGRLLENMVYIELLRKGFEVFYYRNKYECDFIVRAKKYSAIQVCYELTASNRKREVTGLMDAMKKFRLKNGIILTIDQEEKFRIQQRQIIVRPVWKWLLE